MPNWCECRLIISNNNINNLETFYIDNKNESQHMELCFDKSVPLPDEEEENWYNWRVYNWGTKWDLGDDTIYNSNYQDKQIEYNFCTAWSPPVSWLEKVSELYPELYFTLKYAEPGCNFAGVLEIQNGEDISDQKYSYSYHQWLENKNSILNDIYLVGKELANEEIIKSIKKQKYLIEKVSELPDELIEKIVNYNLKDIEINCIKKLIINEKVEFKELLEEDYYIYETEILTENIFFELK
jgi:hypothetical protein